MNDNNESFQRKENLVELTQEQGPTAPSTDSIQHDSQLERTCSNPSVDQIQRFLEKQQLGIFKRLFSGIDKGSMRIVVGIWIRMSVGVGMFALPGMVSKLGLLHGFILILVCAFFSYITCKFVYQCHYYTKFKTFEDISKRLLPKPCFKLFRITYLIDVGFSPILYSLAGFNLFLSLIHDWSYLQVCYYIENEQEKIDHYHPNAVLVRIGYFVLLYLFIIPLSLKKSLQFLKKVSIIYLFSLIFLTISVILQFYPLYKKSSEDAINWKPKNDETNPYELYIFFKKWKPQWFSWLFTMVLSFYVQPFIMGMRNDLLLPTIKRLSTVAKSGILVELFLFLIMGLGGYCAMRDVVPGLIVTVNSRDVIPSFFLYIFKFLQILFLVLLTIGIPCFIPYIREYLETFNLIKNKEISFTLYSTITIVLACLIGICYPEIIKIFGLMGVTVNNYNGFIVPILMKLKMEKEQNRTGIKFVILIMLCLAFVVSGLIGIGVEFAIMLKYIDDN